MHKVHNDIIDISIPENGPNEESWRLDEKYDGIYPEGAREKDVYFSPQEPCVDVVKPNWRYLFKLSRDINWCPWQFWVEVIAYRIGLLIGVEVPPAHIGYTKHYDVGNGSAPIATYGALIEWFYNDKNSIYTSGGPFMSLVMPNFDRVTGKEHNLEDVMFIQNMLNESSLGKGKSLLDERHWAKVFTFDTLIANTDRHQDNWGIIRRPGKTVDDFVLEYAPAFDNGTALGYSIREKDLSKYKERNKRNGYLLNHQRAKHHIKYARGDRVPLNYYEFMTQFVLKYPKIITTISQTLNFTRDNLRAVLDPLCDIVTEEKYLLSRNRLEFMIDMIMKRKILLTEALKL